MWPTKVKITFILIISDFNISQHLVIWNLVGAKFWNYQNFCRSELLGWRGSPPGPALGLFAHCSLYIKACYRSTQTPGDWERFPNDSLLKYQESVIVIIWGSIKTTEISRRTCWRYPFKYLLKHRHLPFPALRAHTNSQGPPIGRTKLQGQGHTPVIKEYGLFSLSVSKEKVNILLLGFKWPKTSDGSGSRRSSLNLLLIC